ENEVSSKKRGGESSSGCHPKAKLWCRASLSSLFACTFFSTCFSGACCRLFHFFGRQLRNGRLPKLFTASCACKESGDKQSNDPIRASQCIGKSFCHLIHLATGLESN